MQKRAIVCKIHQNVVKYAKGVLRCWFRPEAGVPDTTFEKYCPRRWFGCEAGAWDTVYVIETGPLRRG